MQCRIFESFEWAMKSARLIQESIQTICDTQGKCSVMLTGGRSAEHVYAEWRNLPGFKSLNSVTFYFGDERCVPPANSASNYGMAMRTLFALGVPPGCSVFRMDADEVDRERATLRYEGILPDKLDIILLSVGEDGHIASLFPRSAALYEPLRRVVPLIGPKPPQRLTITPPVLENAGEVFVLALGEQKHAVYQEALRDPADIDGFPARLVLNRTWIFGE
jgi:6-phosphogluconolactonase/glucosamine-6-phosphate isomerase/deaminase